MALFWSYIMTKEDPSYIITSLLWDKVTYKLPDSLGQYFTTYCFIFYFLHKYPGNFLSFKNVHSYLDVNK